MCLPQDPCVCPDVEWQEDCVADEGNRDVNKEDANASCFHPQWTFFVITAYSIAHVLGDELAIDSNATIETMRPVFSGEVKESASFGVINDGAAASKNQARETTDHRVYSSHYTRRPRWTH